jgi:hydrogenase nickel incorporation protein HypA/HybF
MSIVQALIDQVGAEVARAGQSGRVIALELSVGRLSGVHVEAIRFAFELLSPGTLVEGARLNVAEPTARVSCQACGACTPIPELVMHCPACGSGEIAIQGGQELLLQSIELEEDGPA